MFDRKCYEVAEYFLPSDPALDRMKSELAQHVQDAVEDWLAMERERLTEAHGAPID